MNLENTASFSKSSHGRGTIVIVDDTDAARYVRARTLSGAGYTVHEAASGADALQAVVDTDPDLVVLDVKLPDISGIEVCRAIKRNRPKTLILQTSAYFVERTDRVRGLETGADAYIVEPVAPDELLANVAALFRLRQGQSAGAADPGAGDPGRHGASRSDLLLREIRHHTKNDFQTAISLLSLQSHRSADPAVREALRDAMDRLRAMAQVHEQLYTSSAGTSVDCASLIRAVCHGIVARARQSSVVLEVTFAIEPLVCGWDRAVPIALVTNEVMVGAFKRAHGVGCGKLHVALEQMRRETVLRIMDDSARGLQDGASEAERLGEQLITALASQLGKAQWSVEQGRGTTFELIMTR